MSQLPLHSEDHRNEALGRTLRRIARGDPEAFDTLYRQVSSEVYRYLASRGLPRDAVEEALQDTFLAIWRDAGVFHGESAYAWIWAIARHKLNDAWRRQGSAHDRLADAVPYDSAPDPAGESAYAAVQARDMLTHLSPGDRDLAHLVFVQELSYRDAAAALGIPVGTVKSRVSRIRRQLQRQEEEERG